MITGKVTIKDNDYDLGELSFSEENVRLLETILGMGDDQKNFDPKIIPGFQRALHEALVDGSGEEKAAQAIRDLKISMKPGSDLMKAFDALGKSLCGA